MSKDIRTQLHAELAERTRHLQTVAEALKTELFGIDDIIDRVIDSIRAWYVLPQLISRPVIVCLWGLTGTGKTQLVRRLAQHLGFYDRFIEVQMDGFSHGSGHHSRGSISAMLAESGIAEGMPGILVLDEFQRFRTVDSGGNDAKVERYQDVWALLSDGRLPPALSMLGEIESSLAYAEYTQDRDGTDKKKYDKKRKLHLSPWEAREVKRCLKLSETLLQIMAWKPAEVHARLRAFRDTQQSWETDYSKLLVFVSGNLDEMYAETAQRVEDCDTDADIFHAMTKKLSMIDVKKALGERFKPEQIARLGNTHVIYPSLSQATYERLIRSTCARYVDEMRASAGLSFELDESVYAGIYANAVFPAQGTRPLFSSIHAILSAPLVNAVLWALEQGVPENATLHVALDAVAQSLRVSVGKGGEPCMACPVPLDLNEVKQRASPDFRALLAVHEAGHGLAYARLFGRAPQEMKINVASFEGGYNSYVRMKAESRQSCLDRICVSLAGRAAEALVFGEDACTTGSESDFKKATALASRFVRHFGFGSRLSRTDVTSDTNEHLNTDVEPTNAEIEALLAQAYARARELLAADSALLLRIVDELLAHGQLSKEKMAGLLGVGIAREERMLMPYAEQLQVFSLQHELMRRVRGEEQASPEASLEPSLE